jgi:hypothetical protein
VSDIEDRHDMRVVEARGELCLTLEPMAATAVGGGSGVEDFQGDGPIEVDVDGLVNDPHAAGTEFADDPVSGQAFAAFQSSSRFARFADEAAHHGEAIEGLGQVFFQVGVTGGEFTRIGRISRFGQFHVRFDRLSQALVAIRGL